MSSTPSGVRGHRVAALAERWNLGAESRILLLPAPLAEGYGQHLLLEAVARLDRHDLLVLLLGPEQARQRLSRGPCSRP